MSERGYAAHVLATLLGYVDQQRRQPSDISGLLQTARGQYLHCIGHSFGGRFLAQAIALAAERRLRTLPLLPRNEQFPFTVDNFLVFQMAARPDIFDGRLGALLGKAPLQGPVCLTFSTADRANCFWHRLVEGAPGIGCSGASRPSDRIRVTQLRSLNQNYDRAQLAAQLVNVDASWRYRHRSLFSFEGAHSDFSHEESVHLLLSLMEFAR